MDMEKWYLRGLGGGPKALAEVQAIHQRQPDRKEWRIGDARRGGGSTSTDGRR